MTVNIAHLYAASLAEVGNKNGTLLELEDEIKLLSDLFANDSSLGCIISSPMLTKNKKKVLIKNIFSGRFSKSIVNLLNLLIENGRQSEINGICREFIRHADIFLKRKRVYITTPFKIEKSTREMIKNALRDKLDMNILLYEETDTNILGGIKFKIDDMLIDGSIQSFLLNLKETLLDYKLESNKIYED